MKSLHIETPCIFSSVLSQKLGFEVYLKLENCQPTGSFKLRGIGAMCSEAAANGAKMLVSSSSGNAGLAAAYSGRKLGIKTKVFVTELTPDFMKKKIMAEDAEVIVYGRSWDEANVMALKEVQQSKVFYVSPFDHPTIWKGNSTAIDEIYTQIEKPGMVVVAVGGGGLLLGILEGLHRKGWKDVPVMACETEGMASFAATFNAKKLTTLTEISGVATSLGAKTVSAELLKWFDKHSIISSVVSDNQALESLVSFLEDHRFLVEPACGAALTAAYFSKLNLKNLKGPLVIIVCGGALTNLAKLGEWRQMLSTINT